MTGPDRVIFGDNQFFGINHRSEEKAISLLQRFQDDAAIIEVLDAAYDAGIHAFTFSTHGRIAALCDHFRAHPARYADLRLYPAIPYAHKYADLVNEKGIPGALNDAVLSGSSIASVAGMIAMGGAALLTKDALKALPVLIDVELKVFRNLRVPVVFLQNIVTDLMMGLGWKDAISQFAEHVSKKHGAEPGFISLNLPMAVDFLESCGIVNPIVCSAINKAGFQMNPGREACERVIRTRAFRPIAMSILAAGAIPPAEAIAYVGSLPKIESVLFGASHPRNIVQTKELLDRAFAARSRGV